MSKPVQNQHNSSNLLETSQSDVEWKVQLDSLSSVVSSGTDYAEQKPEDLASGYYSDNENKFNIGETKSRGRTQRGNLRYARNLTNDTTSDYSSSYDEPILGSVQRRTNRCKCLKPGVDRRSSLANEILTEEEANEIGSKMNGEGKRVARRLGIKESTIWQVDNDNPSHLDKGPALLLRYMQQEGCDATKGRLADALLEEGRRDLAEKMGFEFKKKNNVTFMLEGLEHLTYVTSTGIRRTFYKCRDINDGEFYLVEKLEDSGFEEACEILLQKRTIGANIPSVGPDSKGIINTDEATAEVAVLEESQNQLVELIKILREVTETLEKQERHEDRIDVPKQLEEDEYLLKTMTKLRTETNMLTGKVGHLKDTFLFNVKLYNFSLEMNANFRDLHERIKMLFKMITSSREGKLSGANCKHVEKIKQMMECCRNLELQIRIRDKYFVKRFEESQQNWQRANCSPSDPNPRPKKHEEDVPTIRRASTQPVSQNELKELAEQVSPPADPMEGEEGGFKKTLVDF